MMLAPIASDMTDRVDVLRSPQSVRDGEILSLDGGVAAFDVPCQIIEVSASRAQMLLGTVQQSAYVSNFYADVDLRQNDTLRVCNGSARYIVKIVHRYPSPHDCQVQVAELVEDLSAPRSPRAGS